jgi:hypothetical protein
MDGLRSTKEAAEELGMHEGAVRKLRKKIDVGKKIGRDWFFSEDDLQVMQQRPMVSGRPRGSKNKPKPATEL